MVTLFMKKLQMSTRNYILELSTLQWFICWFIECGFNTTRSNAFAARYLSTALNLGFTPRKWVSNNPTYLDAVLEELMRYVSYYSIIGLEWSLLICCEVLVLINLVFRAASLTRVHHVSQQLQNTRCYSLLYWFSNPLAHKAHLLSVSNSCYNSCVKIN
jgi:hypothetical protein